MIAVALALALVALLLAVRALWICRSLDEDVDLMGKDVKKMLPIVGEMAQSLPAFRDYLNADAAMRATSEALIRNPEEHSKAMIARILEYESSTEPAKAAAARQILLNLYALAERGSNPARLVLDVIERQKRKTLEPEGDSAA